MCATRGLTTGIVAAFAILCGAASAQAPPPWQNECRTPWDAILYGSDSVTAFAATSVACGLSCATVQETRLCSGGVLSGSFAYQSCSPAPCNGCSVASGTTWTASGNTCTVPSTLTIAHAATATATDTTAPTTGSATYACNDGTAAISGTPTCAAAGGTWTQVTIGPLTFGLPACPTNPAGLPCPTSGANCQVFLVQGAYVKYTCQ